MKKTIALLAASTAMTFTFGLGVAHAGCHTTCDDDGNGTTTCDTSCD